MIRQLLTASDPTVGITARVAAAGQAYFFLGRECDPRDGVAHNAVGTAEELVLTEVARHERIVDAVTQWVHGGRAGPETTDVDAAREWLRQLVAP